LFGNNRSYCTTRKRCHQIAGKGMGADLGNADRCRSVTMQATEGAEIAQRCAEKNSLEALRESHWNLSVSL